MTEVASSTVFKIGEAVSYSIRPYGPEKLGLSGCGVIKRFTEDGGVVVAISDSQWVTVYPALRDELVKEENLDSV